MNKKRKIYLAIPYSHMEESSYKQATDVTAKLIEANNDLNIFSPITHSHPLTKVEGVTIPGNWEYWKEIDYQFIDWADEVWVCLPEEGLQPVLNSIGVQAEIKYAKLHNKPVKAIINPHKEDLLSYELDIHDYDEYLAMPTTQPS